MDSTLTVQNYSVIVAQIDSKAANSIWFTVSKLPLRSLPNSDHSLSFIPTLVISSLRGTLDSIKSYLNHIATIGELHLGLRDTAYSARNSIG